MAFSDRILERARANKKRIVLAEGFDARVVKAAGQAHNMGIGDITLLVQSVDEAQRLAEGQDLSGVTLVEYKTTEKRAEYAKALSEIRKSKGMTEEQANALLEDPLYYGVMMVKMGDVDGMVAGAANATSDVLRPALQIIKAKKGTSIVSAFFVMTVPDPSFGKEGTMIFADSGMVINPNAEELAAIALSSAETARTLCEMEPLVAMLSFSTKGSALSPESQKVIDATAIAKEQAPALKLDGELQLDAALVPSVGESKAPGSPVAGKANVLIFPDLGAGNIGYKLTERLAKAEALGPIVQGLALPVNDLSRGCSVEDIIKVVGITVVQAQEINA
ncbi:phosphate acetyltransferase [Eubacteriales bacterium OttesenSCG-928-M02]|nr:phosphate acetyltransferase [Eubacteriales bacterium OttesenSCG-928-M02]